MEDGMGNSQLEVSNAHHFFVKVTKDVATSLRYQKLILPWPLDSRDTFVVQEIVRVFPGDVTQRSWFFSYNHDIEHVSLDF